MPTDSNKVKPESMLAQMKRVEHLATAGDIAAELKVSKKRVDLMIERNCIVEAHKVGAVRLYSRQQVGLVRAAFHLATEFKSRGKQA